MSAPDSRKSFLLKLSVVFATFWSLPRLFGRAKAAGEPTLPGSAPASAASGGSALVRPDPRAVARHPAEV